MASRRAIGTIGPSLALLALGAIGLAAWQSGLWGTVIGTVLGSLWLIVRAVWHGTHPPNVTASAHAAPAADESLPFRLVLDQIPIPLIDLRADAAHAVNRAARAMFSTDDRILPLPAVLRERGPHLMTHHGRRFRIDRVETAGGALAALIDIDAEERTAEARATADMIQVFGHEMLNGLAPIVSLAESGLAAIQSPHGREELLPEILGTLARRAEGLLRFTDSYRTMARLPDPVCAPTSLKALGDDLAHLFSGRWGARIALRRDGDEGPMAAIDRDQITQAVWALLQNGAEAALAGGGDPWVSLSIRSSGSEWRIEVSDSGPGVSDADAVSIFRPFFTTKPEGTGVGLSLARQIILAHGGTLTLRNGRPTRFRLEVPH